MKINNPEKDGIFLVDKPIFKTSNKLILDIKHKLKIKKIGHAGTLDPLATGLMVVLVNKATKLSNYLLTANKEYLVTMKLFIETDTYDILGKITKTDAFKKIKKNDLKKAFIFFNNSTYEQYPPIYSAIKYNGKKLYEYARKKIDIEIKTRKVTIDKILINNYDKKQGLITFYVKCSKGTYVRSLVKDIAKKLNTLGTVFSLRRLASGNFDINSAQKLNNIKSDDLISIYDALKYSNFTLVQYDNIDKIKTGNPIELPNNTEENVFICDKNNKVLAIYTHVSEHKYKCLRGI